LTRRQFSNDNRKPDEKEEATYEKEAEPVKETPPPK
jgi:hypothetical protein